MAECKSLSKDCLQTTFERAADHLTTLAASLDSETLLYLYARFKQAKEGPCNISKPGFFNFQAKQKWEAWNELGRMSPQQAMQEYIDEVKNLDVNWECDKDSGASKNVSSSLGFTVSTLRGQDFEVVHDDQKTLFDWVKEGNIKRVTELLHGSKTSELNQVDAEGMTLLHWASDRGYVDMVKLLLQCGSNINQQDSDGQTALHYASSCGHANTVRLLLSSGADESIADNEGLIPFDVELMP